MVRLPHLLALLCGFAVALAVGCGDRSNLIPSSRASELNQQLSDLQGSIAGGQCDGLSGRVQAFHDDAASLGGAVDKRLRSRINAGAKSLQQHAAGDCQAAAEAAAQQTDTQPSEATPPDTQTDTTTTETQTDTTTTETQTDTVPTDTTTTTVPPTPTVPTPTVPTETGAAPPSADNGGTSDGGPTP